MSNSTTLTIGDRDLESLRQRNMKRGKIWDWVNRLPMRDKLACSAEFQVDQHNRIAVDAIRKYASQIVAAGFRGCRNLVLFGGVGTGKTVVAWAGLFRVLEIIYQQLNTNPRAAEWFTADVIVPADLEAKIRNTFNNNGGGAKGPPMRWLPACEDDCGHPTFSGHASTEDRMVEHLAGLDLLILDEVALTNRPSEFSQRLLYSIVNRRYSLARPTIVTSNRPLGEAFQAGCLDLRVVSRLSDGGMLIEVPGPDRRSEERAATFNSAVTLDLGFELDPDPSRLTGRLLEEYTRNMNSRWSNWRQDFDRRVALVTERREFWNQLAGRRPSRALPQRATTSKRRRPRSVGSSR